MVMDEQVINCSMMHHWSGNTVEILPGLSSGVAGVGPGQDASQVVAVLR